jgi:cyanophycinase-like exopeptidase
MRRFALLLAFGTLWNSITAQNYTSYFTGNTTDAINMPQGGICLMGGATEEDEAVKWFLNRANGGDILVLRASGSDGYNDYFYTQLGIPVNSVETIVFNNAAASNDPYIHQKIEQAEAIWFAGGDQWDYISYWRNTPVDSLINLGINERNIAIGGTSAGMAIQGGIYFSAENGTVTSNTALSNPFDSNVTADTSGFLHHTVLEHVITDTHYDNPDRKGRHVVFLARIWEDYGIAGKGIACDEYTAVCIDENNIAHVYGQHPTYDDNAYFLQVNCELSDPSPETCTPGSPLTWNLGGTAIKVYTVKGTLNGSNTFDLNDWQTGTGGTWQNWSVNNGVLSESNGSAPNCTASLTSEKSATALHVFPNPAKDWVQIECASGVASVTVIDATGKVVLTSESSNTLNTASLHSGMYVLCITTLDHEKWHRSLVVR